MGSLGHLSEPETGLIYMRARYYDPATGRFESEDPAKVDKNWFMYCDNNPINEVDLTGRDPITGEDAFNKAMDALAIALFERGKELMGIGWANVAAGMGDIIYGDALIATSGYD